MITFYAFKILFSLKLFDAYNNVYLFLFTKPFLKSELSKMKWNCIILNVFSFPRKLLCFNYLIQHFLEQRFLLLCLIIRYEYGRAVYHVVFTIVTSGQTESGNVYISNR